MNDFPKELFDVAAETACLGLILSNSSKANDIFGNLSHSDFGIEENWKLFRILEDLRNSDDEISVVTILDRAQNLGWEGILSSKYIRSLSLLKENEDGCIKLGQDDNLIFSSAEAAVKRVKYKASSRSIVTKLEDLLSSFKKLDYSIEDVCIELQEIVLSNFVGDKKAYTASEVHETVLEHIQAVRAGIEVADPTGFEGFDRVTGGLRGSDLLTIAGLPKGGKSALALTITDNFLIRKIPVIYFNMEMTPLELELRRVVRRSALMNWKYTQFENVKLTISKLLGGYGRSLSREEADMAMTVADEIKSEPLFVVPSEIKEHKHIFLEAQRLVDKYGAGLVIWDHAQLTTGAGSEKDNVVRLCQDAKTFVNKNDVAGIILSQLNQEGIKWAKAVGRISSDNSYGSGELSKSGTIITNIWLEDEKFRCGCEDQIVKEMVVIGNKNIENRRRKHDLRPTVGTCIDCGQVIESLPDREGGWCIERSRSSGGGVIIPLRFFGESMNLQELR